VLPRSSRAPLRPCVWLAVVLGAGSLLGLAGGGNATLALTGIALVQATARWRGKRARTRSSSASWNGPVALPLIALAAWRASALPVPPDAPLASPEVLSRAREAEIRGTWHRLRDGRGGWVEPARGRAPLAGHGLVFLPTGWTPEEGATVSILPGSEAVPGPRGPEPCPGSEAATSRVAPDELVVHSPAPRGLVPDLRTAVARLRERLAQRLEDLEGEWSAGLLRGLVAGDRSGLSPERRDLFARTGTRHLLAISGWHVGLFALLVLWPLGRLPGRLPRGLVPGLRGATLLLFVLVAGAQKPVLRAALAWALFEGAARARPGRDDPPLRPDGLSALGAAFALECLLDPAGLRSLSLQLSYVATLGLLLGMGPLVRALRPRSDPLAPLRSQATWQRALGALGVRMRSALTAALAASTAAVLATLPLVWSSLGEVVPLSPLTTLLALPPFVGLCASAWLGALWPTHWLAGLADALAHLLIACLELADTLPGTPLPVPPRPALGLLVLAGATLLAWRWVPARRPACLLWGLGLLPWSAAPVGLELWSLDVGHGTACCLRAPGLEALLFDAGSRDRHGVLRQALGPLLARWEVAGVTLVASHAQRDHGSELERLVERYPVRALWGSPPARALVRLPHDVLRQDLGPGGCVARSGAPVSWTLLRGSTGEDNEGSRSLLVRWRGERLLLTGDAEGPGLELPQLEKGPLRLLLAPHHGSEASGLGRLLDRCPPGEVWISASRPPPIAAELDRRRIPWLWTARDGPLALRLP